MSTPVNGSEPRPQRVNPSQSLPNLNNVSNLGYNLNATSTPSQAYNTFRPATFNGDFGEFNDRLNGSPRVRRTFSRRTPTDPDMVIDSDRPKFHLKEVARDVITKLRISGSFKDKLCEQCSNLQLGQDKFIIHDHSSDPTQMAYRSFLTINQSQEQTAYFLGSGSGKFRLGSFGEINLRSSRCPLCRLVRESLSVFHYDDLIQGKHSEAVCFAIWQLDGREVERDDIGRITWARPRTRRIQLRWDIPELESSYLVLMAPGPEKRIDFNPQAPSEHDTLFLGRNIASSGNNQALAKRWMDLCNDHHGHLCTTHRGPEFDEMISSAFFGVVDVHEMKLTSLPPNQPYLALSYMWGNIEDSYTTTLHNIQARQSPGALGKILGSIPKVIRDAMNLVRGLGMKYIWIDSLCIVQDSSKSWKLNSSVMDLLYGNAYLTICAADGQDSAAGLRGISPDRYVTQYSQYCGSVRLGVSHLAETYVEKSRWNTRAWTFQERLLSKRCLIFAGGRVFFQCRSSSCSEDIVAEQKKGGWSIELTQSPLQLLQGLSTRAFWVYTQCVRLYTARELTRSGDILAAFQGMSNLMAQKLGAPLIFGLPSSHFDLALLWEPVQKSKRRMPDNDEERQWFQGLTFPSWSWCGWKGSAMEYRKETIAGCLEDVRQWHAQHTWINWYIRDSRGSLRLVWSRSQSTPVTPETEPRWLGYHVPDSEQKTTTSTSTATNSDPTSSTSTTSSTNPTTTTTATDDFGRQTSLHPDLEPSTNFYRTLPEYPYKISITSKTPTADQQRQDQQFLQFWTWSAYLRVIPHEQTNFRLGEGLDRYDIADYTGDWCGTIVLDDPWEEKPGSEHEFIAISDAKEFSQEENDNWSYYIPRDRDQSDWSLYYVLLIKRERGIARRIGLGKVFKDAFKNSCLPGVKWREIILE